MIAGSDGSSSEVVLDQPRDVHTEVGGARRIPCCGSRDSPGFEPLVQQPRHRQTTGVEEPEPAPEPS